MSCRGSIHWHSLVFCLLHSTETLLHKHCFKEGFNLSCKCSSFNPWFKLEVTCLCLSGLALALNQITELTSSISIQRVTFLYVFQGQHA